MGSILDDLQFSKGVDHLRGYLGIDVAEDNAIKDDWEEPKWIN